MIYKIKKGKHHCTSSFPVPLLGKSIVQHTVIFNESAIYQTVNPVNQFDINKLFGFTEGFFPHKNSARMGWTYEDGSLNLYGYAYVNGIRMIKRLGNLELNTSYDLYIKVSGDEYIFGIQNVILTSEYKTTNQTFVITPRRVKCSRIYGFELYPYFGGDEVAPHDITIKID